MCEALLSGGEMCNGHYLAYTHVIGEVYLEQCKMLLPSEEFVCEAMLSGREICNGHLAYSRRHLPLVWNSVRCCHLRMRWGNM